MLSKLKSQICLSSALEMNRMMVSPSSSLELDYYWLILSPPLRIHAYSVPPTMSSCESLSVMSDCLWSHRLYSPWNSLGQNSGVGSLSLLQGIFPNPEIEPRSPASQADSLPAKPQGKPKNTRMGSLCPSPADLFNPGIKPGSPALQADSLPTELSGNQGELWWMCVCVCVWVVSDSLGPHGL